jgi:hypothetical protein
MLPKLSKIILLPVFCCSLVTAQQLPSPLLNRNRPLLDAHNCYPYEGKWSNRIERALGTGTPVAIEQDLAWYVDPATGKGTVVVSHKANTDGTEPTLRRHFFERVRPMMEAALKKNDRAAWPIVTVHFDFKDNQPALLHAVWELLGEYEGWMTTAKKTANPAELAPFEVKPLLVLTEDSDAQEQVFFSDVPVGGRLRLFGSAHTTQPKGKDRNEQMHLLATVPPAELLREKPTDYRRWWNNSWYEVEEGGQPRAGEWTPLDAARLRALVDYAHGLGFWIRFYTLDGFSKADDQGWGQAYNFGSPEAVRLRWKAALDADVDLIATDQYEELAAFMRQNGFR